MMKIVLIFCAILLCSVAAGDNRGRRYDLYLLQIKQQTDYYSGPAAGESILRYFGLTPEVLGIKDSHQVYQTFLANQMWTDFYRATSTYNFWQAMNHFIQIYNLNQERPYELREVQKGYSNLEEFFNIVTLSLTNNVPVVVVTGKDRRFLVITGVSGNSEHATYTYINSVDGTYHIFQSTFLPFIFMGAEQPDDITVPSHILAYVPQNAQLTPRNSGVKSARNTAEKTSSTKCAFLVLPSYVLNAYGEDGELIVPPLNAPIRTEYDRRKKRSDFEIVQPTIAATPCTTVDIENPYRDTNDHIRVWFRLLAHNGIEVKMTRETAISLIKIYIEHDRKTFLDYATSLMQKIMQVGKVLDTDHAHAAQVLYEGMPYIHQVVARMTNDDNFFQKKFVFLQTYRTFTFQDTLKKRGMEKTVFLSTGENV